MTLARSIRQIHHVHRIVKLKRLYDFGVHRPFAGGRRSLDYVAHPLGKAKHELVLLVTWEDGLFHAVELTP